MVQSIPPNRGVRGKAAEVRRAGGRLEFSRPDRLLEEVLRVIRLFSVEETGQLADTGRMAHLAQRLGLDLADALTRNLELLADSSSVRLYPSTRPNRRESTRRSRSVSESRTSTIFFAQERERGHVVRVLGAFVLDEIPEAGVVAVADGRLERDRLLRHLHDLLDAFDGHLHLLGDLLRGGFVAVFLEQLLLDLHDFVERLDHVHRNANGAGLVGNGPGDGLADPPRGVSGELVAAAVLKLFDRLHQPHVALLDQVEE